MKKVFIFTLLAAILISCEGKRGKDGKDGLLAVWKVVTLPVKANDWQPHPNSSNVSYYSVIFNVPDITKDIFLDGLIQCYRYYDDRQIVLPYVRHLTDGQFLWTQTIDYEYYVGGMEIFLTNSDFYYDSPPESMTFVLQILY